jgi:hypothetical protein
MQLEEGLAGDLAKGPVTPCRLREHAGNRKRRTFNIQHRTSTIHHPRDERRNLADCKCSHAASSSARVQSSASAASLSNAASSRTGASSRIVTSARRADLTPTGSSGYRPCERIPAPFKPPLERRPVESRHRPGLQRPRRMSMPPPGGRRSRVPPALAADQCPVAGWKVWSGPEARSPKTVDES